MRVAVLLVCLPAAAATYVGNEACKPCHTKIYNDYSATPMAQSSGRVTSTPRSAGKYAVDDHGVVTIDGRPRQLDWFIGSGAAGRSYLYAVDGHLFQAPITWYSQRRIWDTSPGYTDATRWNRPVDVRCLYCHASQPRAIYGTENRFADPPFGQGGVGCERCHGPGSDHIAGRAKLVKPAKLEASKRDAVCAQCHLSGEARIDKAGRSLTQYRPGDELTAYVSYFVYEGRGNVDIKATGYVEKLAASRCKVASGDKLWCGSCHDPHMLPTAAQAPSYYRDRCRSCHEPAACDRGPDCRTCHMPRGKAADGGHGVLTDHAIPRKPSPAAPITDPWRLRPFLSGNAEDRELGLAYAEVSLRTGNASQRAEAIRLLSALALDVDVAARLADLVARDGKRSRALELYRRAVELGNTQTFVLVNLGALEAEVGNHTRAEALWRQALKSNPGLSEAAANLATLLNATGRKQEGEAVMRRARDIERGQAESPAPRRN